MATTEKTTCSTKRRASFFHVGNLPDSITNGWLREIFTRWETVQDVFIPRKRDAAGRVFAFVRMSNGVLAEKATHELNGHYLTGIRLQVNPAIFQRGVSPKSAMIPNPKSIIPIPSRLQEQPSTNPPLLLVLVNGLKWLTTIRWNLLNQGKLLALGWVILLLLCHLPLIL